MQQWEYRVLIRGHNEFYTTEEWLISMGEQGWENYAAFERTHSVVYYFKRPKPQPSTAEKRFNEVKNEVEQEGKFGVDWYARPQNER